MFGRAALCGAISQYNSEEETFGPRNMQLIIGKSLTLRGFVVPKYMDMLEEFQRVIPPPLVATKQIKFDVTIRHGVESLPSAFLELFQGGNTGKMIVEF
ncbi:Oxidoreductase [Corynebacterium pseudotuberculosis]|nr:Oxidoreductase [Corynebacterium pseudotuberculosis]